MNQYFLPYESGVQAFPNPFRTRLDGRQHWSELPITVLEIPLVDLAKMPIKVQSQTM
ncbi:MAG TPA: hypothetical protein VGV18_12120 [Verrucomicrobiae bacterium]|nr:hypothetical protein [Verrucomicrobiae bacterium]